MPHGLSYKTFHRKSSTPMQFCSYSIADKEGNEGSVDIKNQPPSYIECTRQFCGHRKEIMKVPPGRSRVIYDCWSYFLSVFPVASVPNPLPAVTGPYPPPVTWHPYPVTRPVAVITIRIGVVGWRRRGDGRRPDHNRWQKEPERNPCRCDAGRGKKDQ